MQGLVGLLQGQKSNYLHIKKQQAQGVIFCCLSMHGKLLKLH